MLLDILLISFGVAVDASAVSAAGAACPGKMSRRRCALNAALFFGGFQILMPVAGFFAAGIFTGSVAGFGAYIACALLIAVGAKMIWEAWKGENPASSPEQCPVDGFFAAKNMFAPAVATSLDALAVGAGLAFSGGAIWLTASAMGLVTAGCSALSVYAGHKLAERCDGKKVAVAGGLAIVAVGVKIVLEEII